MPDINSSSRHREKSIRAKILSNNNSIEWDNLINTSIPNTLKNQNFKLNSLNKLSDVSYLKNPKKNTLKIGTSIYKDPEIEQNVIIDLYDSHLFRNRRKITFIIHYTEKLKVALNLRHF